MRFLGDPAGDFTQKIKLPATPTEKFGVFAQDANGIAPSPIPFRVSEFGNVLEIEPNDTHATATKAELPLALNGEQRFLSCSLNLSWPDIAGNASNAGITGSEEILTVLSEIFDATIIGTRAINSRAQIDDGRFAGWLSYSGFDRSLKAMQGLHQALRRRGMGVRQWSRDLFIPRAWQFDRAEPPGGHRQ